MAELDELKRLNEAQEKKKGEAQQSRKEGGWPVKVRWPMTRNSWRSWGFWPFRRATGARKRKSPVNRPQRRRRSPARFKGTASGASLENQHFAGVRQHPGPRYVLVKKNRGEHRSAGDTDVYLLLLVLPGLSRKLFRLSRL